MITYFALDLHSKKFYIGSTSLPIENRIKEHKKSKVKYAFQNALKCRPESFFWIWGEDDLETRDEEQFYLNFHFGSDSCYNLNPLASAPPSLKGSHKSEETKRKIGNSKIGKPRPDVSARNKSGTRPRRITGNSPDEITRFKEMARRPKSEEHCRKLGESKLGKRGYNNGYDYCMFTPGLEPEGWVPGKPKGRWKPIERGDNGRFKTK